MLSATQGKLRSRFLFQNAKKKEKKSVFFWTLGVYSSQRSNHCPRFCLARLQRLLKSLQMWSLIWNSVVCSRFLGTFSYKLRKTARCDICWIFAWKILHSSNTWPRGPVTWISFFSRMQKASSQSARPRTQSFIYIFSKYYAYFDPFHISYSIEKVNNGWFCFWRALISPSKRFRLDCANPSNHC